METNRLIRADKGSCIAAKEIGNQLKMLRLERKMTPDMVCEKAGIKPNTLNAIENGFYNSGIKQISNIAQALGAHIEVVKEQE